MRQYSDDTEVIINIFVCGSSVWMKFCLHHPMVPTAVFFYYRFCYVLVSHHFPAVTCVHYSEQVNSFNLICSYLLLLVIRCWSLLSQRFHLPVGLQHSSQMQFLFDRCGYINHSCTLVLSRDQYNDNTVVTEISGDLICFLFRLT